MEQFTILSGSRFIPNNAAPQSIQSNRRMEMGDDREGTKDSPLRRWSQYGVDILPYVQHLDRAHPFPSPLDVCLLVISKGSSVREAQQA